MNTHLSKVLKPDVIKRINKQILKPLVQERCIRFCVMAGMTSQGFSTLEHVEEIVAYYNSNIDKFKEYFPEVLPATGECIFLLVRDHEKRAHDILLEHGLRPHVCITDNENKFIGWKRPNENN